jgi:hypothetical protein
MRKLSEFEAVEQRSVVAGFDGGNITSNAVAPLPGQVARGLKRWSRRTTSDPPHAFFAYG